MTEKNFARGGTMEIGEGQELPQGNSGDSSAYVKSKALVATLTMIAEDMAADAAAFDGRPFNGRTVAEYFGNQGAAIAALANIIKATLLEPVATGAESQPVANCAVDPVAESQSSGLRATKVFD